MVKIEFREKQKTMLLYSYQIKNKKENVTWKRKILKNYIMNH